MQACNSVYCTRPALDQDMLLEGIEADGQLGGEPVVGLASDRCATLCSFEACREKGAPAE